MTHCPYCQRELEPKAAVRSSHKASKYYLKLGYFKFGRHSVIFWGLIIPLIVAFLGLAAQSLFGLWVMGLMILPILFALWLLFFLIPKRALESEKSYELQKNVS